MSNLHPRRVRKASIFRVFGASILSTAERELLVEDVLDTSFDIHTAMSVIGLSKTSLTNKNVFCAIYTYLR